MTTRVRPGWAGTERDQLTQVLDYQRATVRMTCEGLSDADRHPGARRRRHRGVGRGLLDGRLRD